MGADGVRVAGSPNPKLPLYKPVANGPAPIASTDCSAGPHQQPCRCFWCVATQRREALREAGRRVLGWDQTVVEEEDP